jgi:hypothetical protein
MSATGKQTMKWQERDRPQFPGHEPKWEDSFVLQGEDEPAAGFWLQCEYRQVPAIAALPLHEGSGE